MRNPRFQLLKRELARELGIRVELMASGAVLVHATEFSSAQIIHSVQGAFDLYARHLSADVVNPQ